MDEATQLALVRKAITSRLGGCCEWEEKAAERVRSDRSLQGLSREEIKELLQDFVAAHPEAVTARRESRE
jgi:Glu-tRNA(Gln) amidotransferase subunit E-like FAD-binding protein